MLSPIILDSTEQKIFNLLRRFVSHQQLPVVMRVAGGWVRDKLLGLDSHDMDIALDTCTGEQFALQLCEYIDTSAGGSEDREGRIASAFGVIQRNPEQSKHLAAATMALFGRHIDFVNLRSETYAETSRIPIMKFGTPLEDAQRRDLTINALFYNLQRDEIEDFTSMGISDLENGFIRTPLEPLVTLEDDPLRVLRAIRFAARYRYRMAPGLEEAIQDLRVTRSFHQKISRERVGMEFFKMCLHPTRIQALGLIARLKVVYGLLVGERFYDVLRHAAFERNVDIVQKNDLRVSYHGAVAILFLRDAEGTCQAERPLPVSLAKRIMLESLKSSNRDADEVSRLLDHIHDICSLCADDGLDPVPLGRAIRQIGREWRESFLLAHVCHDSFDYRAMVRQAEGLGLDECYSWRPLLNGNDIVALFPKMDKRGLSAALGRCLDWQYQHPRGSAEELRAHLADEHYPHLL